MARSCAAIHGVGPPGCARPGYTVATGVSGGTGLRNTLAVAGGVADRGSMSRIKIVRIVDGSKREIKVSLGDVVQPGDTLWDIARVLQPEGDRSGLVRRLVELNGGAELAVGDRVVLPA